MKYLRAIKIAVFNGWGDIIINDNIYGNGFIIFAYGLKLIVWYFIAYILRIFLALFAPLSAFIVLEIHRRNEAHRERCESLANKDL